MPGPPQRGSSPRWRRLVRWAAGFGAVFFLVLTAVLLLLRIHGVPRFVQTRIEEALRERGVVAHFTRLRLRGLALQAENVRLAPVRAAAETHAVVDRAELRLGQEIQGNSRQRFIELQLEGGQLYWQPSPTNGAPPFAVRNLRLGLRLSTDDQIHLTRFEGDWSHMQVHGSLALTNASALRQWKLEGKPGEAPSDWPSRLQEWLIQLQMLDIAPDSTLVFHLSGDAQDPATLNADCRLQSRRLAWPKGTLEHADLYARTLTKDPAPGRLQAQLDFRVERALVGEARGERLQFVTRVEGGWTNRLADRLQWQLRLDQARFRAWSGRELFLVGSTLALGAGEFAWRSEVTAQARELRSEWASAERNQWTAQIDHGRTLEDLWQGRWAFGSGPVASSWGNASSFRLAGEVQPQSWMANWEPPRTAWGFWEPLAPYWLDWSAEVNGLASPQLNAESLRGAGQWRPPEVTVDDLSGVLFQGAFQSSATLNVETRALQLQTALNFDLHSAAPWLTEPARHWLGQLAWTNPPTIAASASLVLPPWTNAPPQWREEVLSTLAITGEFAGRDTTFRGVRITAARSQFALSNGVWSVPDLWIYRPDGEVELAFAGDTKSQQFEASLNLAMDPRAAGPLVENPGGRRVLNEFQFKTPPVLRGRAWGNWKNLPAVGFAGRLDAADFIFRNELCSELSADLVFTNLVLHFTGLRVRQNAQLITVPSGSYIFHERVVVVTNALSTMDPDMATRVIGPKVRAAVRPYHFNVPPTVRVNGRIPTVDEHDADVRFDVVGEKFQYWKFQLPSVSGEVHWKGDALTITNVQGQFYGGDLAWRGQFDFSVPKGARFKFHSRVNDANFHDLMTALGMKDHKLAGSLDAHVDIDQADSEDWGSWNGTGQLRLRDGFLWDIPIFGFFSPVLNTVVPGLGHSPVSAGESTFKIEQSIIRTSNLELKSQALRLRYKGKVDFQGKLNARMRAEILRDTWGVGRVLSMALWPISKAFEYRLTGTVNHPKTEPVYIPKPLLWPLHPFRNVRKLFSPRPAEEPVPATTEPPFGGVEEFDDPPSPTPETGDPQ